MRLSDFDYPLPDELIAQSPKARVMESRFKGLSDVALSEAKRLGCTYADIRFTRNVNDSVAVRDRIVTDAFGFGAGGLETSAGFGVRVIHSGVWGFASSPFVTEDEIRKITAQATDDAGNVAVTASVTIAVSAVAAPAVAITNPAAGAVFVAGNPIPFTAAPSGGNGPIAQVQFFVNGASLGAPDAAALHQLIVAWQPNAPGQRRAAA